MKIPELDRRIGMNLDEKYPKDNYLYDLAYTIGFTLEGEKVMTLLPNTTTAKLYKFLLKYRDTKTNSLSQKIFKVTKQFR